MKIRKAIIPAAGLGTRFLPATKALPKEMLPIIDKPTIQYIVEEAAAAGIEEVAIITNRNKKAIEDHFDKNYELEDTLLEKNKIYLLNDVQEISNLVNIYYIRQKEANGLGDAILCAKNFIGNEPFAVLLGDDIVSSNTPCIKQLIKVYEYWNSSVVGVQKVPKHDVSKYGIIKTNKHGIAPDLFYVDGLVEKPDVSIAPSQYAIMGRYILKPEIFEILETIPVGQGGEIQLTDAINELNQQQAVLAYEFEGKRFDIGNKLGFIKATIDFALERNDTKLEILEYMKNLLSNYTKRDDPS